MNSEQDTFNLLKYRSYDASINAFVWHNDLGQRHQEDGPAVEYLTGEYEWAQNGKLHRIDGPAVEFKTTRAWWINGVHYSRGMFENKVANLSK